MTRIEHFRIPAANELTVWQLVGLHAVFYVFIGILLPSWFIFEFRLNIPLLLLLPLALGFLWAHWKVLRQSGTYKVGICGQVVSVAVVYSIYAVVADLERMLLSGYDTVAWIDTYRFISITSAGIVNVSAYTIWSMASRAGVRVSLPSPTEADIAEYGRRVFDSSAFWSTYNETVVIADDDRKHGIQNVPHLKRAIESKRTRHAQRADMFLRATLALGMLFTITIGLLGYILVDERAVGTPRRIDEVKRSLERAELAISDYAGAESEVTQAITDVIDAGNSIREMLPDDEQLASSVDAALSNLRRAKEENSPEKALAEIDSLLDQLQPYRRPRSRLLGNLASSRRQVDDFEKLQAAIFFNFTDATEDLKRVLPSVEAELEKPSNRIPELIKRLAVSIVVATFFLAVLRYLTRMHGRHLDEVIAADKDAMQVHKFVVSIQSSEGQQEVRKAVLQEFLSIAEDTKPKGLGKKELELWESLVQGFMKRMGD